MATTAGAIFHPGEGCPAPKKFGHRGPPITQRPANSPGSRAIARPAEAEKTDDPPEPQNGHGSARREQSFDPFEPEAGVARPLVEFDPRHALVASTFNMAPSIARPPRPQAAGAAARSISAFPLGEV